MSIKFGRIGTCEPPSEMEGLSRGKIQYGGLMWSLFKMAAKLLNFQYYAVSDTFFSDINAED